MKRRAILGAALALLLESRAARATGNVSAECPPLFIRTDPIRTLWETDLRHWAQTNPHAPKALCLLMPQLAYLRPTTGEWVAGRNTTYRVEVANLPQGTTWIIAPACLLDHPTP